jgi:hypothetical protein
VRNVTKTSTGENVQKKAIHTTSRSRGDAPASCTAAPSRRKSSSKRLSPSTPGGY